MSSRSSRAELVDAVLRASRKGSAQAALFSQAVADRLGLAGSDVECLDILEQEGRLTVGRLAELTGLTTGSATRMVDRLEQAGYVRRVPDPADRRRVLVE
ncbi:MAG: MarR family transcriptional regulator, partial [Candidatus Limnocylindrales bacterium]